MKISRKLTPPRPAAPSRPSGLVTADTALAVPRLISGMGLGGPTENAARRQLARVGVMTGMDLDDVGWQPGCPRRDERFLERTGCEDDRAARQRLAARSYDPART